MRIPAFESLVDEHRRTLHGIARSFARQDRDDLFQEILLQAWRSWPEFKGQSAPGTWLYRIAINTALTWRRKSARRERHSAPAPDVDRAPHTPLTAGGRGELEILDEFVHALDALDRALFALYLEDVSYRDIAEVTGITETNVGVRLTRIKKRFTTTYIGA